MKDHCSINTTGVLTLDQAIAKIEQAISPITARETLPLRKATGRILAQAILSPMAIPPERIASMDGYACNSEDLRTGQSARLTQVGTSWAGKPYTGKLQNGQCIRIFTGAVVPAQADSVVMQEHVSVYDSDITFPADTEALQNIRPAGGDIRQDQELLPAGKTLTAIDCALLASAGVYEVNVRRKLRIAFFSTGDELRALGSQLQSGQIYDSNRYALTSLLADNAFSVTDLGVIKDNEQQLEKTLLSAAATHDVIITTGGASVGEADFVHQILNRCGQVNFWKIAMKPGKPLIFGKIGNSLLFGLPGNPVSVVIIYQKIVLPALRQLSGTTVKRAFQLRATCATALRKAPGRQEYQRGILQQPTTGEFIVEAPSQQDSHHLSALSKANCYIVLPAECAGVEAGEIVTVEPFSNEV